MFGRNKRDDIDRLKLTKLEQKQGQIERRVSRLEKEVRLYARSHPAV